MRVIWIILDSVGAGALPDAAMYGDESANTLNHIADIFTEMKINNLRILGLGNIPGLDNIEAFEHPIGMYGRCKEMSQGKDTITGHWEMVGIKTEEPFKVYPDGFSADIIEEFIDKTGCQFVLANKAGSGTALLEEYGDESIRTGYPIVYTSADSVFQIAADEETVGIDKLYEWCEIARKILVGDNMVARVIARPFIKKDGKFIRTARRHDYAISPDENNLLPMLKNAGYPVVAIGKISDIFCNVGITKSVHTVSNQDGIDKTLEAMNETKEGLIFTNLVEFDSTWGHRRDVLGYKQGLEDFDKRLPEIIVNMKEDDVLIINADHGCDPTYKGTDHTREYIPLLVYGKKMEAGKDIGTRETFADIGASIAELFGLNGETLGHTFI